MFVFSTIAAAVFSVANNGNTLFSSDPLVLVLCRTCDVSLLSTPDDDYCHANKGRGGGEGGGQLRVVCLTITRQRKGLTQSAKGWKNTYGLLKIGS